MEERDNMIERLDENNKAIYKELKEMNKTLKDISESGGGSGESYDDTELKRMIKNLEENKQDTLKEGKNVKIRDNEISVDLKIRNAYESIEEIGNVDNTYLFDVKYKELDYPNAEEYFRTRMPSMSFGCSAIVKNGVLGRNYDWFYSEQAEFIVRTNKTNDRYGTIGVASLNGFEKDEVKSGNYEERYKIVPFSLLDGVNEKGLEAAILVVPYDEDNDTMTTGTTVLETREDKIERINALMFIRYILDHYANIEEVQEATRQYLSVYVPQALRDMGYECHFLIKDDRSVYALEFINNECVWIDITEKPILTNFKVNEVNFNDDGSVPTITDINKSTSNLNRYSQGLERYNILLNSLNDSSISIKDTMKNVKYSQLYTKYFDENAWVSEYCGTQELQIDNDLEDFETIYIEGQDAYIDRSRENPLVDHTVHTSIYDNNKLYVYTQENYQNNALYEFPIIKNDENPYIVGYYHKPNNKFYNNSSLEYELKPKNNKLFIDVADVNNPTIYLCIIDSNNEVNFVKTTKNQIVYIGNSVYRYGQTAMLPKILTYILDDIYNNAKNGIPQTLYWKNGTSLNTYINVLSVMEFPTGSLTMYNVNLLINGIYNCVYSWDGTVTGNEIEPQVIDLNGKMTVTEITQYARDDQMPTAKAVRDYVNSVING